MRKQSLIYNFNITKIFNHNINKIFNYRNYHNKINKFSFQLISDIHLELNKKIKFENIIIPKSNYLFLAGDIGYPKTDIYQNFIEYCSKNFKKIFLTSGNHEYYNYNMNITDNVIYKNALKFHNVYYLNKNKYEIDNKVILGTTLWTNINKNISILRNRLDFRYIMINNRNLTIKDINLVHKNQLQWLLQEINNNSDKHIIILTHHMPSFQLVHQKYKNMKNISAYYTDLEYIMKKNHNIKYWLCGHTHESAYTIIEKTICMTNPYGIQKINKYYKKNKVFYL